MGEPNGAASSDAGHDEPVQITTATGATLAAVLRLPVAPSPPVPAVVLCQGLSGVKHLVLPDVAAGLAARGIASVRFDYAGCGESGGTPGWIDPRRRTDDAHHVLAWLAAHDAVDAHRLGVYGHSYGGPVAITLAARDRRVQAVVSVSGPGDGPDMLRAVRPSWDWLALERRLEAERAAVARGAAPTVVRVDEIFPFSPAFRAAYEKLTREGGTSALVASEGLGVDAFYLLSVDAMLDFHPTDAARRVGGRPLLLVHGAEDDTAAIETVHPVYAAAPGPKRFVVVPDASHNDLDSGPGLARAIDLAAGWFAEHL